MNIFWTVFHFQIIMNFTKKQISIIISLLVFSLSYCQIAKTDSLRGEFTYLLNYKPNSLTKDYMLKEFFSLQITDTRAFFISDNQLKFDSAFTVQFNNRNSSLDLRSVPSTKFTFLIIHTVDNTQFYQLAGMTSLSYNTPIINTWKLIDETKIINSVACKKAEVRYKGRDWTAWYSTEIPFPYGPYKFSGLPGLIVKITDKTGDYDFELVKSLSNVNLKGKVISVNDSRYKNAKLVTQKELVQARENFRQNARKQMESMGTVFMDDDNGKSRLKESEKAGHNPIELED